MPGVRIAIASGDRSAHRLEGEAGGNCLHLRASTCEEREYCVIGDARRQSFYLARVSDGRLD